MRSDQTWRHVHRTICKKNYDSARSLLVIINDILDFSKMEAGRIELEHVSYRLDDVLQTIATFVGESAEEKRPQGSVLNPSRCPTCIDWWPTADRFYELLDVKKEDLSPGNPLKNYTG